MLELQADEEEELKSKTIKQFVRVEVVPSASIKFLDRRPPESLIDPNP